MTISSETVAIAIIGGGLSGLSLAYQLSKLSQGFQLYEARSRFGGRILSRRGFDFGPSWFWPGQNRIKSLIDELALDHFVQFEQGLAKYDTHEQVHTIANPDGVTSFRFDGGVGRLVDALVTKIDSQRLNLGYQLKSIEQRHDGVRLRFYDASAQSERIVLADKAVLCLPPRLVAKSISFTPELSAGLQREFTDTATWMAGHAKTVISYSQPFWREKRLSGLAFSQIGPLAEIHDACWQNINSSSSGSYPSGAALFGFSGWPPHMRKQHTKEQLHQLILTQLARIFGPEAEQPLNIETQDWLLEPFTSTELDEKPLNYHPQYGLTQQQIWQERVLFSGTESARTFGGYLEGALESSEDALRVLLD